MNKKTGFRPLVYIVLLAFILIGSSQADMVTAEQNKPFSEDTGAEIRAVQPVPGFSAIPIDANSTKPAVAHGGEHYLVVYTQVRKVFARSIHNNGTLGTAFEIDSHSTLPFSNLSIAYHPESGLFVVAYELCNLATPQTCEVRVTAVSHTGKVWMGWVYTYSDARAPSIACSHIYDTCLLAYESEFGTGQYIRGNYLTVYENLGIQSVSTQRNLSNLSGKRPYLAVGKNFGYYMITFTQTVVGVEYPVYNHIYESPPPPSFPDAYVYTAKYVLDFSADPHWTNKNKWATDITYDPCTEHFIILFDFDYSGNRTKVDVYMAAIHKLTQNTNWSGHIANRNFREESGGISFVTNYIQPPTCGMMDKLVVTYTNYQENKIYAVEVRGNNNTIAPIYDRDVFANQYSLMLPGNGNVYSTPNIAGGSTNAELLIVYDLKYIDDFDPNNPSIFYNVYGWRVHVMEPEAPGGPVIGDFIGTPTNGVAPLTVAFTNMSTGNYDTCTWEFGDGATNTSCKNPIHTYQFAGVYTVKLTVTGGGLTGTRTRNGYITVGDVDDQGHKIFLPLIQN